MKIKISKRQWELIGKKAGWTPRDPMEFSDADLGPIMTPDEEEEVLLGPEDPYDPFYAYKDGYKKGSEDKKIGGYGDEKNPYGTHSNEALMKFDQWRNGYKDGYEGKPSAY